MTTYQRNQLGINEITSLYSYGQDSKPPDLRTESIIRPPGPMPIDMDEVSFMATGPGQSANASQIRLVQAFMGVNAPGIAQSLSRQRINPSDTGDLCTAKGR